MRGNYTPKRSQRAPNLEFLNHIWGGFGCPPSTFWFLRCFSNFDKPTPTPIWLFLGPKGSKSAHLGVLDTHLGFWGEKSLRFKLHCGGDR